MLRHHIRDALKHCYYINQFEQRIKEKGYEIIKGRGISFADEKKVKVKGSELNYSLQTIENYRKTKTFSASTRRRKHRHKDNAI